MLGLSKKIICYEPNLKNFPNKYLKKIYLINPILRKEIYLQKKNEKKDFSMIKKIVIIGNATNKEIVNELIYQKLSFLFVICVIKN